MVPRFTARMVPRFTPNLHLPTPRVLYPGVHGSKLVFLIKISRCPTCGFCTREYSGTRIKTKKNTHAHRVQGCRFESRYPGTLVYPGMNSYPRTSCTQCTGRNWSFHKFNFQHRRVAIRNKHVPGVLLIVLLLSRGEELLEILTRVSEYPGYLGFQFGGTVKIVIDIDDKNEST